MVPGSVGELANSKPKSKYSRAHILALSLAGTRQSMERLVGVKTSLGLTCPGGGAPTPKGSPERLWRTDATDPCTLASAPAVAPSAAARAPSWDSWKGGGAAKGAVIPTATTPCVERVCSTWWVTA